ncbi:hypothetical protein GY45DRAFT_863927 [Cubamyces sp. BRFM 1775]|nr:hypothetical protein GY45DRAFT_863927 [Cubamyces sp. BRFM 1775]
MARYSLPCMFSADLNHQHSMSSCAPSASPRKPFPALVLPDVGPLEVTPRRASHSQVHPPPPGMPLPALGTDTTPQRRITGSQTTATYALRAVACKLTPLVCRRRPFVNWFVGTVGASRRSVNAVIFFITPKVHIACRTQWRRSLSYEPVSS